MVSEQEIAHMVMLSGMGFDGTEIANRLGMSSSTVYKYLGQVEDRARGDEEWRRVYYDVILADVFDSQFRQLVANSL